ncbi:hypothetical protein [Rubricoccus marinus]|uniref:Lipoprotein n=1 Tax=Rubricoccus marinus TaxID=716817 RepID=A0A259U0W8_9BACT|nr:hypothetical protein [Rubricoccus marinus]OZC03639.1 hypothetical protein BSZ36_11995 [Rubricoccus marinus]
MLRSLILVPALLILATGGCSGSTAGSAPEVRASATGEPFVLAQGESVEVAGHALRFLDVVEDSRCPEGVTCVWEGRAKVRLSASTPQGLSATQVLTLPYAAMTDEDSAVWDVGGVVVELLDVLPMSGPDDPREVELRVTASAE